MILFFRAGSGNIVATGSSIELSTFDIEKLVWLFGRHPLFTMTGSKEFSLVQEEK